MARVACWSSLLLFTIVVSQPLFYGWALGRATRQLSAASYVELRQQINLAIATPLKRLYVLTLAAFLLSLGLALYETAWPLAIGAACAALALVADAILATKLNVPINQRMDRWDLAAIPSDWAEQRARWDRALAIRRIVLVIGFVVLSGALCAQPSSIRP